MYVAIYGKPENGCEIQDSCDGVAQIMLRLQLVKDEADEQRYSDDLAAGCKHGHGENVGHGTKVVLEVVKPYLDWQGPLWIVCGDSYFASIATCKEFATHKIGFIGIIIKQQQKSIQWITSSKQRQKGMVRCIHW